MDNDIILGWHFLSDDGTAFGGYRPPDIGIWEPPIKNPEPCVRGYHGSPTILKALQYAQGPVLGRCEYRGVVWHGDRDKWAARGRRCIARVDASSWLRFAAAHIAERAIIRAGVTDERCHEAIRVARRFALGEATAEELCAVRNASHAAAHAARASAYYAAHAAAYAAAAAAAYAAAAADAAYANAAAWADEEQWFEEAALDLDCAPLFSVHPTR